MEGGVPKSRNPPDPPPPSRSPIELIYIPIDSSQPQDSEYTGMCHTAYLNNNIVINAYFTVLGHTIRLQSLPFLPFFGLHRQIPPQQRPFSEL